MKKIQSPRASLDEGEELPSKSLVLTGSKDQKNGENDLQLIENSVIIRGKNSFMKGTVGL